MNRLLTKNILSLCIKLFLKINNGLLAIFLLTLLSTPSFAATYIFPGSLPSGCSGSSGTYTCSGALSLASGDVITIGSPKPATITISGNFYANNAQINTSGSASNLTIIVNGVLTLAQYANINANIQAIRINDANGYNTFGGTLTTTTNTIYIGYASTVAGTITSTTGAITMNASNTVASISCRCALSIGYNTIVNGDIKAASLTDSSGASTYNGSITTTSGGVSLAYSSDVNGFITSATTVNLAQENNITSCVQSTSSSTITLGWHTNANSVCCGGSSCSTSCVTNNSAYSMPSTCTLEAIVVRARGTPKSGVYPIMELWINETKISSINITSSTYSDYTFYASIPSGTFKLDIVYSNDASGGGEDRNFFINSVVLKGKTFYVIDPGVTIDRGSGSAAFDGVSTLAGQSSIPWNAAVRFNPDFTATLLSYHNMDESSWNGTSNELIDTAGYTSGPYHGTGIGSPVPTAANASRARAGTTGTCGYAAFSGNLDGGSAFTIPNLSAGTSTGAKTSVSFWMYWNGTDYVTPIGWHYYNLYFADGYFGFNTGYDDLKGVSTSGLANGWHHIVAVFNNGNVSSSKLYIDGVNRTLTQVNSAHVTNAYAYVTSTLLVGGWTVDSNYRFTGGRIDELKVYNGEISQTQVTADYAATHTCPTYVTNIAASNFNCVATSANASSGHLYTQIAGTAFTVDVVALNASSSIETSYAAASDQSITLEFVDGSGNTACASRSALSPTASQTVTFSSSNAGRKTVSATISKAYADLRCRVTDANQSPSVVACSSDDFAVRPSNFTVTSTSSADADSTGASAAATPKIKTGSNFTLTATADATGYNGTPTIDTSKLTAHSGATQTGTLAGSFSAASSTTGAATGAGFTYNEVGYFRLAANGVYDSTFTVVDSDNGDCTTGFTASGGINACSFGNTSATNYFGRFYPDHFAISSISSTPACGAFNYYGQDGLTTIFTLTAQNSSNATTQNYTGTFASNKFDLNTWASASGYNFLASGLTSGSLSASATAPTGSWVNGVATNISAKHKIDRLTLAMPPASVTITTKPTDSDGVTMATTTLASSIPFRYGKLSIPNAYGSELLPLSMPIEAQYWNGSAYQRNQLDSCTTINPINVSMGNYKNNLATCETQLSVASTANTTTMVNGKITAKLTKPGNGNNGSVDLFVNLNAASDFTCIPTSTSATSANLPWFGSTNPAARATFGLHKSPVIYMRESY